MNTEPDVECWPVVGRGPQLAAFDDALTTPGCWGFQITGEAGAGKSRLAEECLARATRDGRRIARAVATKIASNVPLGAIGHLLGSSGILLPHGPATQAETDLMGETRPHAVLFVDDVHLLDEASAELLSQAVINRGLFLLTTVRSSAANKSAETLALGKGARRAVLGTLSETETAEALSRVLRGRVGRGTVHQLHKASSGTPVYLRELVRGALKNGALRDLGEIWDLDPARPIVTPRLIEMVGSAFQDARKLALAQLLAVAGTVALDDAIRLMTRADQCPDPRGEATAAIAALEASGLLTRSSGPSPYLSLSYPVHGQVLRATMPLLRRRQLLPEQVTPTRGNSAWRQNDPWDTDSWRCVTTSTAGPHNLPHLASSHRAHDLTAAVASPKARPSREHTGCAERILRPAPPRSPMSGAIWDGELHLPHDHGALEGLLAKLSCHLEPDRVAGAREEPMTRAHAPNVGGSRTVQVHDACAQSLGGEPARGLAQLSELPRIPALGMGRDAWLMGALAKSCSLAFTGRTAEATALAEQMIAHSRKPGWAAAANDPAAYMVGLLITQTEAGRLDLAREAGEQGFTGLLAAPRASLPLLAWTSLHLGRLELISGHLAQARVWYAEAIAYSGRGRLAGPLQRAHCGLAAAAAQMGDLGAARRAVTRATELIGQTPSGPLPGEEVLGAAWLHAAEGRLAKARTALAQGAERARACGHDASEAMLLTDMARLGENTAKRLKELADSSDSALSLIRAKAAAALARRDADALLAAAQDCGVIGTELLATEAATAAADAYQRQGLVQQAASAVEMAKSWRRSCAGALTVGLAQPEVTSMLTERELEVALLVSSGVSNREGARLLNLSVRTVENHVQRIFAKLGIERRHQLAQALGR